MTQVSAVILVTRGSGADGVYAREDLPSGGVWIDMPTEHGYWSFRGDVFLGGASDIVGEYSPTTADELTGFGMAIPDGLLGMVEAPWISSDDTPYRTQPHDETIISDKFLVAYLAQGEYELVPEMVITCFHYDVHRWCLPADAIVVAWKALPDFPIRML